jgi:hypothetical protein
MTISNAPASVVSNPSVTHTPHPHANTNVVGVSLPTDDSAVMLPMSVNGHRISVVSIFDASVSVMSVSVATP